MKKIKLFITIFLSFFAFNIVCYADGTTTYYIEANIQSNGDMDVRELKVLDGEYNGIKTTLRYKSDTIINYPGFESEYLSNSIYNGTKITNLKVYDVKNFNGEFEMIHKENTLFTETNSGSIGDFGVYEKTVVTNGVDLKIYMPSSYKRASLVTYTIEDVVVYHDDVAEILWNFIGSNYEEDIENLKVIVNLPGESNELRVFSHGPLNGNNEIVNKKQVSLTYDYLAAYNEVDLRVVFDNSLVSEAVKKTNKSGLEGILDIEQRLADYANTIREEEYKELEQKAISYVEIAEKTLNKNDYQYANTLVLQLRDGDVKTDLTNRLNVVIDKIEKRENIITTVLLIASGLWIIGLVIVIRKIYVKYDKEYQSTFNNEYYRDFPASYGPEVVEYLINRTISQNSFSATILNLVRKKVLKLEKIDNSKKDDYLFTKLDYDFELSLPEQKVLDLLINTVGNGKSVKMSEIKSYSKNYSSAQKFMNDYNEWNIEALELSKNENFYESVVKGKVKGVFYALIPIILIIISVATDVNIPFFMLLLIPSIVSIIYFIAFTKKTKKGNDDYHKWMAFKKYLTDFGRLNEKDLPEVYLWEKYLVYATSLGIADLVSKQMKIKLQNIDTSNTTFTYMDLNDWYFYHTLNKAVRSSITTAKAEISSHNSSSSSNYSSGSGFGGGSSFGGGFGGGGSGGGRF